MIRLSVNVNKVATLRNSRGGRLPSVVEAVETCIAAGAPGITVHPRADRRHITPDDVRDIARVLGPPPSDRAQHRRRSAPGSDGSGARGPARINARSSRWCRVKSPARQGGGPGRAPTGLPERRWRRCDRPAFVSACSLTRLPEPITWAASIGRGSRRVVHRTLRPRVRGGSDRRAGLVRPLRARRPPRARGSASGSMPDTIWISRTSCCSGRCRISMRSRSATPSSRARCSSGSPRLSANTSTGLAGLDVPEATCWLRRDSGMGRIRRSVRLQPDRDPQ